MSYKNCSQSSAWLIIKTFSALLAVCSGNSPITGEFPTQWPVTRSFDVFFDLDMWKLLSKQSWCWLFETTSRPLWRHCNVLLIWYCCNTCRYCHRQGAVLYTNGTTTYSKWHTSQLLWRLTIQVLAVTRSSHAMVIRVAVGNHMKSRNTCLHFSLEQDRDKLVELSSRLLMAWQRKYQLIVA